MNKLRVVFDNRHQDYSGGGEHVRMLISLFLEFAEVYVTKTPEFYATTTFGNTVSEKSPHLYSFNFRPDLYVLVDYRGWVSPIGYKNAQICFYAVNKKVEGYQFAFCLNKFVADSVRKNWGAQPIIVEPFFDGAKFFVGGKQKKLINIGNFFLEEDGHSKNQHLLLEWFIQSGLVEEGWEFDFFGFVNNKKYFDGLVEKYGHVPAIRFYPNAPFLHLQKSLSESRFLIHAMGYGRVLEEQTEHFGLVVPQALLAGCRPLVHLSGGCQFIDGVIGYSDFSELSRLVREQKDEPQDLREFGVHFRFENSLEQLGAFVRSNVERRGGSVATKMVAGFLIKMKSIFGLI